MGRAGLSVYWIIASKVRWQTGSVYLHGIPILAATVLLLSLFTTVQAYSQTLQSGQAVLKVEPEGTHNSGLFVFLGESESTPDRVVQRKPAEILVKEKGALHEYAIDYSKVSIQHDRIIALATIKTAHGSIFEVRDTFRPWDKHGNSFQLARVVTVITARPGDEGFNSRFSLGLAKKISMSELQFFSPGLWYNHNAYAARGAIGSNYSNNFFYYREMRTALPFISMRSPKTGLTVSICHLDPHVSSGVNTRSSDWLVSGLIQYASLGVARLPDPRIGMVFPGIEGNASYVNHRALFIYRSHPVQVGFTQRYSLIFRLTKTSSYAQELTSEWRFFYRLFDPIVASVPLSKVYSAEIHLLDHYAEKYSGVMGWPFVVNIPDGKIEPGRNGKGLSISYQMGYVGQQLPDAYQLIRYGLLHHNPAILAKGKSIVNFWATKSPTPSGLPQVWYNVNPPTFRDNALLYMRQISDGMEGALAAARIMRRYGDPQPRWEIFCSRFGDWLVRHQDRDGSFARAYHADGTAAQNNKLNTTDPVRFLVELYYASGNKRYLEAARRAGDFSLAHITKPSLYVGGTVDQPTPVQDKEAGVEAIHAYLSLYDVTRESKWLSAAIAAAEYTETWQLAWTYPIRTREPAFRRAGVRGEGFIKSGTSGVDIFMSFEAADYYRLYLYTGDRHFLNVAESLLNNTKLTTDWGGSLGYAQLGLVREASDVADLHVEPDIGWLPWLSDAELSSMTELEDTFGAKSIANVQKLPLAVRRRDNDQYMHKPGVVSNWCSSLAQVGCGVEH